MKVLIVNDSSDALALATARGAKRDTDILCAGGAKTGLDILERETPD